MCAQTATEFGLKKLSHANWRERDPVSEHMHRFRSDGTVSAVTEAEWVQSALETQLSAKVPENIRKQFAVAQGAILYGYFYYPLLMLGTEQLSRVGEAAIRRKCTQLGAPSKVSRFAELIDWLAARGVLNPNSQRQWNAIRDLRNSGSHADDQSIIPHNMAFGMLEIAARLFEDLFGAEP